MEYRTFGKTDLKVSEINLGTYFCEYEGSILLLYY